MTDLIKHSGQVFTPDYLVSLILDEAGYNGEQILQKHCIDNSCGDGAFLCEVVKRYISVYQAKHNSLSGIEKELAGYIHGIEIESNAYTCCLENLKSIFEAHGIGNASIDLRHGNTLDVHDFDGKMDFVIGNPPYVRVHNLEDNFDAVKTFSFANGGMTDLYLVFFEIGFRMLTYGGKLCYITPSSWINSVAGTMLRSYIFTYQNLISVIDLGHFQAFKATTYTMISLFQKGVSNTSFSFSNFNPDTLGKTYVCDIPFDDAFINGNFYIADNDTLSDLRQIVTSLSTKYVEVKNGFATLADKVFISSDFPFDDFLIPVIKASTGKWYKAFYPYDKSGKPLMQDKIFANRDVADYLGANKDSLLKGVGENMNPQWFLFGRTQALKDVYKEKICVNTTIKDIKSIKINKVPAGAGVYSGLYILTHATYDTVADVLLSDAFINYIASLKKYKSGGYYTYNSKDLELYLNFKISQIVNNGEISIKPIGKSKISECHLALF